MLRAALLGWGVGTTAAALAFAPMVRRMTPAHVAYLRHQPVAYHAL